MVMVWNGEATAGMTASAPTASAPITTRRPLHTRGDASASSVTAGGQPSRAPEETGRPDEQGHRRDEVEDGELDLGEVGDPERAHEADDEGADECTFQASQPSDHDDNEREDERVDAHAQHGARDRHDDGAAQPGHEAAQGEGLHVHALD